MGEGYAIGVHRPLSTLTAVVALDRVLSYDSLKILASETPLATALRQPR